jgi:hypothetical protein
MAKTMKSSMTCPTGPCGPKCIVYGLLSAAFIAAALVVIVMGVHTQWTNMLIPYWKIGLYYFAGLILAMIGKCFKMKCCGMCGRM